MIQLRGSAYFDEWGHASFYRGEETQNPRIRGWRKVVLRLEQARQKTSRSESVARWIYDAFRAGVGIGQGTIGLPDHWDMLPLSARSQWLDAAEEIISNRGETAWYVVAPGSELKACPQCGELALEGEVQCSKCGLEPDDDMSWRIAGRVPCL